MTMRIAAQYADIWNNSAGGNDIKAFQGSMEGFLKGFDHGQGRLSNEELQNVNSLLKNNISRMYTRARVGSKDDEPSKTLISYLYQLPDLP